MTDTNENYSQEIEFVQFIIDDYILTCESLLEGTDKHREEIEDKDKLEKIKEQLRLSIEHSKKLKELLDGRA